MDAASPCDGVAAGDKHGKVLTANEMVQVCIILIGIHGLAVDVQLPCRGVIELHGVGANVQLPFTAVRYTDEGLRGIARQIGPNTASFRVTSA